MLPWWCSGVKKSHPRDIETSHLQFSINIIHDLSFTPQVTSNFLSRPFFFFSSFHSLLMYYHIMLSTIAIWAIYYSSLHFLSLLFRLAEILHLGFVCLFKIGQMCYMWTNFSVDINPTRQLISLLSYSGLCLSDHLISLQPLSKHITSAYVRVGVGAFTTGIESVCTTWGNTKLSHCVVRLFSMWGQRLTAWCKSFNFELAAGLVGCSLCGHSECH